MGTCAVRLYRARRKLIKALEDRKESERRNSGASVSTGWNHRSSDRHDRESKLQRTGGFDRLVWSQPTDRPKRGVVTRGIPRLSFPAGSDIHPLSSVRATSDKERAPLGRYRIREEAGTSRPYTPTR